jgi:hypothetical protein
MQQKVRLNDRKPLIQRIGEQLGTSLAVTVLFSISAAFYIHYQLTRLMPAVTAPAIVISLLIAAVFPIMLLHPWRKQHRPYLNYRHLAAAALAAVLLVIWQPGILRIDVGTYRQTEITITIDGETNPSSAGSEVWLTSVGTESGSYNLSRMPRPENWEIINGALFSREPGSSLTLNIPAEPAELFFVSHPLSGTITIFDGGKSTTIDLYNPEGGSVSYPVQGNLDTPPAVIVWITVFGGWTFFLLLFFTYIRFSPRSPERLLLNYVKQRYWRYRKLHGEQREQREQKERRGRALSCRMPLLSS